MTPKFKPNSHCERIYNWMKDYGSVDLTSAAFSLGCFCLPQRIADLKRMGVNIKAERVEGKSYFRYSIVEEEAE